MKVDRLKNIFMYDPDTGAFTNVISRGRAKAGKIAGYLGAGGYLRVKIDYDEHYLHRLAWLFVHGNMPPDQIDHINGKRDDNRICNLRLADNSQNNQNRPFQGKSASGFKGVSLHKKSGLWFAYAQAKGIRKSAGYHSTAEQASLAATRLREKLHGEFANNDRKQVAK